MSKKEFWIRFFFWIIFAFGVPIAIIAYEYQVIDAHSEYQLTGWGLIIAIILFIGAFVILGYLLQALQWSWVKQILGGVRNAILPLAFLYLITSVIATNIEKLQIILSVSLISEIIAIPLNPFPKWLWLKNIKDLKKALKD